MSLLALESTQRIRENNYGRRYTFSSALWSATEGRAGGPAISEPNATIDYPSAPAPSGAVVIFGVRIKTNSAASVIFGAGTDISNTTNPHLDSAFNINLTIDGRLQLRRTTTVLAQTAAGTVQMAGVLQYIAGEITIDPTNGSAVVYLDGAELTDLTVTGVNTSNGGFTTWNSYFWKATSLHICDMYVMDGALDGPHELVPDLRVNYVPPNGNGYSSNFDGSDGNQVNNYQQVDDNGSNDPDDDTTYNETDAAGIDAYALGAMPESGATIVGVAAYAHARKTDAGTAPLAVGLRRSSTNYMGTTRYLPVSYADVVNHYGTDPSTGSVWTEAGFNAAEIVVERP